MTDRIIFYSQLKRYGKSFYINMNVRTCKSASFPLIKGETYQVIVTRVLAADASAVMGDTSYSENRLPPLNTKPQEYPVTAEEVY